MPERKLAVGYYRATDRFRSISVHVAVMDITAPGPLRGQDGLLIATFGPHDEADTGFGPNEENAWKFIAADDLIAACEAALPLLECGSDWQPTGVATLDRAVADCQRVAAQIRAVLAKAQGEDEGGGEDINHEN